MSGPHVVGINPVEALLERDPANVVELCVEKGGHNPRVRELVERARAQGIGIVQWSRDALDRAAAGARHQGVVARVRRAGPAQEPDLSELITQAGQNALFLVLDGVQDPHNLGACLRSAAAAGATAVVVPKDRAAPVTPVVQRASAGATERVPLVRVTNLARALEQLKEAGIWLTGLDGEAETSLYEIDLRGPVALVLGGEAEGLRRLTRESCDHLARIPMNGAMESLNVSVATGIALFEALRQRGARA